ncbi:putative leader peptide [Streptomyces mobaraensis]
MRRSVSYTDTPVTPLPHPPYDRTMRRQADLTKRRAVDLCRVAAMLCRRA